MTNMKKSMFRFVIYAADFLCIVAALHGLTYLHITPVESGFALLITVVSYNWELTGKKLDSLEEALNKG